MPTPRSYGWKRQPFDPRDLYCIVSDRKLARLPVTTSLDFSRVPLLDQAGEGSCGPHTADELIYFDQIVQNCPIVGASRLFIYYWTRYLMGTVGQDSGVDNRTMMKALQTYGFVGENDWIPGHGYDDTPQSMVRQPTADVCAAALVNCISDYQAVIQNLSQMKGVLSTTMRPFMFGFDVFQQMESDQAAANGILTNPRPRDNAIGGHDVTICGYSDVDTSGVKQGNKWPGGHFKFRNHWFNGPNQPWGDGGYGYVPYEYATGRHASDFWLVNSVPGAVVPPPPPPPPPGNKRTFVLVGGNTGTYTQVDG